MTLYQSENSIRKLLSRKGLRELIPASDMSIWRWERDGTFPKHVNIHGRNYWIHGEVAAWIDSHLKNREAADA